MEALTDGCVYAPISNLKFWSGKEISHPLDFLRFNIDCVKTRNVSFRRVFLLSKKFSDLNDSQIGMLVKHHHATEESGGKIKTFVAESEDNSRVDIDEFGNFSVWLTKDLVPHLLFKMSYSYTTNEIKFDKLMVIKQRTLINTYYQRYEDLLRESEKIEPYLQRKNVI